MKITFKLNDNYIHTICGYIHKEHTGDYMHNYEQLFFSFEAVTFNEDYKERGVFTETFKLHF